MEVSPSEPHQLREPDTGAVEQFEQGPVAKPLGIVVPFAVIEERREILFAQAPGKSLGKPRSFDVGPHVDARHPTSGKVPEVSADIFLGDGLRPGSFARSLFHKVLEIVQIPPIGIDGVRRVASSGMQVIQENGHSRLHPARIASHEAPA
jgi:hypothetical protein